MIVISSQGVLALNRWEAVFMKLKAQEGKVLLPEDVYVAEISKVTESRKSSKPNQDGSFSEFFDVVWTIKEGSQKDKTISEPYLAYLAPSSKLGKLFAEIGGVMPAPGLECDTEKLVGLKAKLVVKVKNATNAKGQAYSKNIVESKLRLQ